MSKYCNGVFFTSPYANISPPATSFDMARSSSQNSMASMTLAPTSAYAALATSQPLSRSSSNTSSSTTSHPSSAPAPTSAPAMRRTSSSSSSSGWLASPYRSCLTTSYEVNPTSYLSDDDLLSLAIPVETIPTPIKQQQRPREMTTEEQIQHLREVQEQEEREDRLRRDALAAARRSNNNMKQVRFESGDSSSSAQKKPRRPSQLKRRSTAVRKGLSGLNGPM